MFIHLIKKKIFLYKTNVVLYGTADALRFHFFILKFDELFLNTYFFSCLHFNAPLRFDTS